jgi:glycerol-3-phosphate dehydrogenase
VLGVCLAAETWRTAGAKPTADKGDSMNNKLHLSWRLAIVGVLGTLFIAGPSFAEELVVKKCSELVRMAENYQADLKTVDTVLASAIDAGTMDRIKNYKLKKSVVRKQLESVLKAIEIKGCSAR